MCSKSQTRDSTQNSDEVYIIPYHYMILRFPIGFINYRRKMRFINYRKATLLKLHLQSITFTGLIYFSAKEKDIKSYY